MTSGSGLLVLVATPIGNLGDLSPRAVEVLQAADVIACEDTRHTGKLLKHAGIKDVPLIAVHEHNEAGAAQQIVRRVEDGQTVALVTDAGMPAISDPGRRVVAAVAAAGLKVSVVPGPSAVPAAVAVSGFANERFCFEGFLPRQASDREARLAMLASEQRTSVLYEAPHRLPTLVSELVAACGEDRPVVLVRELTKLYEEVWRGALHELAGRLERDGVKGECVLVLAGAPAAEEATEEDVADALRAELARGSTKKDSIAMVADRLSVPRNRVYDVATTL